MADRVVLDSSALIAFIWGESGAEEVVARIEDATVSTVNLTEVGDFFLRRGGSRAALQGALRELRLTIVAADEDLAFDASELYMPTRGAGLSLGDRFCLALARRLGRRVLTTDRAWLKITEAVDVRIELIR